MTYFKVATLVVLLLAAGGGHAQFLDPPPANASAVNGTMEAASATMEVAPDAIDSASGAQRFPLFLNNVIRPTPW